MALGRRALRQVGDQPGPVGAAPADDHAALEEEFESFVKRYHKDYATTEERARRFANFAANYQRIQAHNAGNTSYRLGLTPFADLSPQEFRDIYTLPAADATATNGTFGDLPILGTHTRTNVSLPGSVDWRSQGAVTAVRNQGSCGSCWAFAAIGAVESAWKIAANQLLFLSEQQVLDCARGTLGCKGGSPEAAFDYMQRHAICTEGSYPYAEVQKTCGDSSCRAAIPSGGVLGWMQVTPKDEEALKEAVAKQPVAVAIDADTSFQLYKSGVLTGTCHDKINHAVVLVGYGTDGPDDYWLIKNSWGEAWGEGGYARLKRGLPGTGQCGVKTDGVYAAVDGAKKDPSLDNLPIGLIAGVALACIAAMCISGFLLRFCIKRCRTGAQRPQRLGRAPARGGNAAAAARPGGAPPSSAAAPLTQQAATGTVVPQPMPGTKTGNSRQSRLLASAPPPGPAAS